MIGIHESWRNVMEDSLRRPIAPTLDQIREWCDRHIKEMPNLPCRVDEMTDREYTIFNNLASRSLGFIMFLEQHLSRCTEWRPICEAKKDRSTIWALLRDDLHTISGRDDLDRWNGLQLPLRHPGLAEDGFDVGWNVSAPVGHGGFPDAWIAGWRPLPSKTQ